VALGTMNEQLAWVYKCDAGLQVVPHRVVTCLCVLERMPDQVDACC
jgi:hypothetical protein